MTTNHQPEPEISDDLYKFGSYLLVAVLALCATMWVGAQLASLLKTGSTLQGSTNDIVKVLWGTVSEHRSNPATAWPEPQRSQLPGAWAYWSATAIALMGAMALMFGGYKLINATPGEGLDDVERLGSPHEARFATTKQTARLRMDGPTSGRYSLGRHKRWYLATESSAHIKEGHSIPGPVAHIGPTRCGKTSDAINGLNYWIGPAIVVDAKWDLAKDTLEDRSRLGETRVFDPSGINAAGSGAKWNPLDYCHTPTEAERMAQRLIDATNQEKTPAGELWSALGVPVLAALMMLAKQLGLGMFDVAHWVISMDQPTDDDPGQVAAYLKTLKTQNDVDEQILQSITANLKGLWTANDRLKGNYFITIRKAVEAFARVEVAQITNETNIDHEWLRQGNNTLYLVGIGEDQKALAPVIGALLATLIHEAKVAHARGTCDGLDDVLVVIDEAGNLQLPQLPRWSSQLAGQGMQLVTIWQTVSQLESSYDKAALTILGNSRSLIFYGGTTDPSTFRFLESLLGSDFHEARLSRRDHGETKTIQNLPLMSANALRTMARDQRLLIQSDLPPIGITRIEKFPKKWKEARQQLEK